MARNEKTSSRVARIASKALNATRKDQITLKEIRTLGGSVLTQAPDRPKKKK